MRNQKKLFNSMILAVGILFAAGPRFAHAEVKDIVIYKCTAPNGVVVFQDKFCNPITEFEIIEMQVDINKSNPRLDQWRADHKERVERMHELVLQERKIMHEKQLANTQRKSKEQAKEAPQPLKVEINVHSNLR